MTSGATCEQCSEDDETTTNGLPSKYRQYVTLSGIDFRTRTNICVPLQRSARQPRTHYCMRWMCLGPLSARQVWVGHWSSYKRYSSEYFNGSIVRKSWKINSGLESCHSSPTMGIRVFDRHNNFIILAVKSIGFGWEIVNHGGAIIFNGNLMDLVVFGWDLVRYVEISLIERISPHLVKIPTYRLKWRSLTVVISPTGWTRIFLQRLALNSCLSNFLSKDLSLTATLVEFWFRSLQIGQFFWVGSRLDTPIKWFICICNYWFYHLGDKILWSQIKVQCVYTHILDNVLFYLFVFL